MITQEVVTVDGRELVYTYSDTYMIENEKGEVFYDAYDLPETDHTYTETDTPKDNEATYQEIAEILLGEAE